MANRKRNIVLRCPVTDEEKALIIEKMTLLKTKRIGAYLRKMAIDGYIIQVDHSAIRKNGAELQKIGTNINQIAKRINATGTVYAEDITEIKELMGRVWQLQRYILLNQP